MTINLGIRTTNPKLNPILCSLPFSIYGAQTPYGARDHALVKAAGLVPLNQKQSTSTKSRGL